MGLTFDGVDIESTYGIIIDGASSWPKPERDVEYIHVPGRSGDILMDNGCWQNVEISYNLCIKDNWKTAFEDFAAWLCSHVGYFRLEDLDRHPGVYRMASFAGPLDPELWFTTDTGVFTVTFNCKPQQFLMSGEDEVAINVVPSYPIAFQSDDPEAIYANITEIEVTDGSALAIPWVLPEEDWPILSPFIVVRYKNVSNETINVNVGFEYIPSAGVTRGQVRTRTLSPDGTDTYNIYPGDTRAYRVSIQTQGKKLADTLEVYVSVNGSPEAQLFFSGNITNPTLYNSSPIISFAAQFPVGIEINAFTVTMNTSGNVTVDCELEDCYDASGGVVINRNGDISISKSDPKELRDFPYLVPGINTISLIADGSVGPEDAGTTIANTTVSITPRWYRI